MSLTWADRNRIASFVISFRAFEGRMRLVDGQREGLSDNLFRTFDGVMTVDWMGLRRMDSGK